MIRSVVTYVTFDESEFDNLADAEAYELRFSIDRLLEVDPIRSTAVDAVRQWLQRNSAVVIEYCRQYEEESENED